MAQSRRKRPYNKGKFVKLINDGGSIKAAALTVGVPLSRALRGRAGLPKELAEAWKADSKKRFGDLIAKGQTLTANQQESLARGTLVDAAVNGETKKGSVRAAELLGKDRRVNLFQNDGAGNAVVIVQPPACVMEKLMQQIEAMSVDRQLVEGNEP